MAANKKPRKRYKPRPADDFATYKAVAKCTTFNEAEHKSVTAPVAVSWHRLQNGIADLSDLDVFADVLATCTMAAEKMDPYLQEVCKEASDAVCKMAERYGRCRKVGLDADSMRVLPSLIEYYDELTSKATAGDLSKWYGEAMRIKAKAYGVPA